jgi:hypothetical protein
MTMNEPRNPYLRNRVGATIVTDPIILAAIVMAVLKLEDI